MEYAFWLPCCQQHAAYIPSPAALSETSEGVEAWYEGQATVNTNNLTHANLIDAAASKYSLPSFAENLLRWLLQLALCAYLGIRD